MSRRVYSGFVRVLVVSAGALGFALLPGGVRGLASAPQTASGSVAPAQAAPFVGVWTVTAYAVTVQSPTNGAACAGATDPEAVWGAEARPRTPPGNRAKPSAPAETTRTRTNPEYTRRLMGTSNH